MFIYSTIGLIVGVSVQNVRKLMFLIRVIIIVLKIIHRLNKNGLEKNISLLLIILYPFLGKVSAFPHFGSHLSNL